MDIREATALILLFRGCADHRLRQRAVELVPELATWEVEDPVTVHRWVLRAISGDGEKLGTSVVVCRPTELPVHEAEFRDRFDLAMNVKVEARQVD